MEQHGAPEVRAGGYEQAGWQLVQLWLSAVHEEVYSCDSGRSGWQLARIRAGS